MELLAGILGAVVWTVAGAAGVLALATVANVLALALDLEAG